MTADLMKPTLLPRRRVLRASAGLALLPLLSALGAGTARAELTEQDLADVKRVESYINNIGTLQASFQQQDPNNAISTGRIYLRRPGRMRVEYDPPNPILIIADGVLISQVDRKLGELSQMPLKQSTAWFLLRDPIEIGDNITVTKVDRRPGLLSVTMYENDEPDNGTVELIFLDDPIDADPVDRHRWGCQPGARRPDQCGDRPGAAGQPVRHAAGVHQRRRQVARLVIA